MLFVVLTAGITVFFFMLAVCSGRASGVTGVDGRLQDIRTETGESAEQKKKGINFKKLATFLMGVGPKKKSAKGRKAVKNAKSMKELDKMLMLAGYDFTGGQWNALKFFFSGVSGAAGYLLATLAGMEFTRAAMAGVMAFAVVLFLFGNTVTSKVKKKKLAIRTDLPDIIDLLVVSVEAGLGFDAALLRLYERNKGLVMEELIRAHKDQQRGLSKKEAYGSLALRCDCREMTNFANAVIQAEAMGISMKTILNAQAESLREDRTNRAYEQAEKAPVKMMIPMVMFIFPCIFVILLAPAAVNIMGMLG